MLKRAVAAGYCVDAVTTVFFAAHRDLIGSLQLGKEGLWTDNLELRKAFAQTSGGANIIRVDDFDCFVVVGLGLGLGTLLLLSQQYATTLPKLATGQYLISEACFSEAAEGLYFERAQALTIAGFLRKLTNKPVVLIPIPNPANGVQVSDLPPWLALFFKMTSDGRGPQLRALFDGVCNRIKSALKVEFIKLPAEADESGILNRRDFSDLPDDLTKLSNHEQLRYMTHGNARYGALMLDKLKVIIANST